MWVTEALARVRSWLEKIEGLAFDEVWFTDLAFLWLLGPR